MCGWGSSANMKECGREIFHYQPTNETNNDRNDSKSISPRPTSWTSQRLQRALQLQAGFNATNTVDDRFKRSRLHKAPRTKSPPRNAIQASTHQKPNNKTTDSYTLKELNPSQPIGVNLKRPHHPIEQLFVLANSKGAIGCIELLNLLELDLS